MEQLVSLEESGAISKQAISMTPDQLETVDTVINDIGIRVYRLVHGPYYFNDPATGERINRHRNVQNLGFLFDIDGIRIFHCGDSGPACIEDYRHFRLDREDIDIAFMGRGFMWSEDSPGVEILEELISADHIVLMHIHHDENQRFIDVAGELEDRLPSVTVFQSPLETILFPVL
jgi:L-ascorbate metabolism protein UlaG (beta-lactamase superfamily)